MNDRWQMLYPSAFLVTFHAKYVPCYAASVLFCIQRRANQMKRARIITAVDYLQLEALLGGILSVMAARNHYKFT